jgi:dephospho-CoA kinase
MTTTYSCPKCSYTKKDVYDFKKSKFERDEKEAKDKKLLADYWDVFCLSEEDGQEYLELTEAMEVGQEVYREELQKYDDPAYQIATHLKKLDITGLEKLLTEKLEKEKYTRLSFGNPEMGQQVVISFTVQDSDSLREANVSTSDLKKLLVAILKDTNWRLMSDVLNYRLGFVSGRLKGYEGEEGMLELAGKKKEPIPRVDSEKRTKYSNHNVVQLQRLYGEVQGRENVRKRRLEKEPKGFAIPAGETYSCHICFTSINSTNGWYDKYGFKCLDCQRAVDEGILPPEVFEEENSWYTDWHVESEFHIPAPTIKKLVRDGKLKPRIVKSSSGRDHAHVFMALENNDLLEAYKRKHTIVFLCGMPASGKSEFGKYLQDKHGYTYIPMEEKVWPDNKLRLLWNDVFNSKNQYNKVEKFVCYLYENYENVVLDWGFPITQIRIVELLKRQWCEIIWFVCDTTIASQRFIKRSGTEAVSKFDSQVKDIKENVQNIEKSLNPKIIDVLKEDKSSKTNEDICSELASILDAT